MHMRVSLVYDAKRFIGKRWSPQLPAEATGLPFDVVPSMSAWGDQLRPTLRVHAGGQQLSFAPEEVGALIVKQAKVSLQDLKVANWLCKDMDKLDLFWINGSLSTTKDVAAVGL